MILNKLMTSYGLITKIYFIRAFFKDLYVLSFKTYCLHIYKMEKTYKYIIINKTTDEAIIQKSVRDISDFINTIYTENTISHNTVSQRLKEKKFFNYYDLLIKELLW